jgi:hypothetical protein
MSAYLTLQNGKLKVPQELFRILDNFSSHPADLYSFVSVRQNACAKNNNQGLALSSQFVSKYVFLCKTGPCRDFSCGLRRFRLGKTGERSSRAFFGSRPNADAATRVRIPPAPATPFFCKGKRR